MYRYCGLGRWCCDVWLLVPQLWWFRFSSTSWSLCFNPDLVFQYFFSWGIPYYFMLTDVGWCCTSWTQYPRTLKDTSCSIWCIVFLCLGHASGAYWARSCFFLLGSCGFLTDTKSMTVVTYGCNDYLPKDVLIRLGEPRRLVIDESFLVVSFYDGNDSFYFPLYLMDCWIINGIQWLDGLISHL